ncbi:NACHT domain-containing protein [bacterium]|nr:NACHT domain-containing protein [bacterium]
MEPNTIISFATTLLPYVLDKLSKTIKAHEQDNAKVSEAIDNHLSDVVEWVTNVQFLGMSSPQLTEQATIALDLYTQSRRFQIAMDPATKIKENDILSTPHHILLLGEPGSGKTTTFKRLALFMLREEPVDENDILQFPMVIRLRELLEGQNLFQEIANLFGLVAEPREIIIYLDERDEQGRPYKKEIKRTEFRIGTGRIENVVPKFLNDGHVLLLLDGLDELRSSFREKITQEITQLSRSLTTSKIVVSCRSGDYTRQMDGFTVLEICPLSRSQILAIKDKWLGPDDTDFMRRLKDLPFFDVANRPLLLTQLLFLYKRYGYFPEQPIQIYAKLINLLLEEWDAERGIKRTSKYAGFDPKRKSEFLALLAYRLYYSLEKTKFKEDDLITAYRSVCTRFRLPEGEAQHVAREIQTHTGIISIGPKDVYEFCHLSLQEYLCADYIVRAPLETLSPEYLVKYSAPLAIATTLSSHPSAWFGDLILNLRNLRFFDESSMASFISRILIERPSFEASEILGFAMLLLFKHYSGSSKVCLYLQRMLELTCIRESIARSLRWYNPKTSGVTPSNFIEVRLESKLINPYKFQLPSEGAFPSSLLLDLQHIKKGLLFEADYKH